MTNRQAAIKIVKVLRKNGFEALLAGGCVRDMVLRRRAKDYDVATNAVPADIIRLFRRTLKVGAKFGVVMVLLDNQQIEVATFRSDVDYTDGRHPGSVRFTNAKEDALRRDFTINGMFYDPIAETVIDYVGGQGDLKKRILRTIGRPQERFREDYLRMLRAVRFSTQLGFSIAPKTFIAICENAANITKISGERICMELEGILTSPNRAKGVGLLVKSGLASAIFPKINSGQFVFAVKVLNSLPQEACYPLALAAFFAGCEDEPALEQLRILKLSRNQIKHIKFLLAKRGRLLDEKLPLSELKMLLGGHYFWDLYYLQAAIQKAENKGTGTLGKLKKRIKELGDVELRPKPLLNGHELIKLGAEPGPMLGRMMNQMYIAQLEMQIKNREEARRWVIDWLQRHSLKAN